MINPFVWFVLTLLVALSNIILSTLVYTYLSVQKNLNKELRKLKQIALFYAAGMTIELPKEAENISVSTGEAALEKEQQAQEESQSPVTGNVVIVDGTATHAIHVVEPATNLIVTNNYFLNANSKKQNTTERSPIDNFMQNKHYADLRIKIGMKKSQNNRAFNNLNS